MNNALPGSLKALLQEPTLQEKLHNLHKAIREIPLAAPEFEVIKMEILATMKKIEAVKAPDRTILMQFLLPPKPDLDELDRKDKQMRKHRFTFPIRLAQKLVGYDRHPGPITEREAFCLIILYCQSLCNMPNWVSDTTYHVYHDKSFRKIITVTFHIPE